MPYLPKYRFRFEATNGDLYTIDVLKDNYFGDIIQRSLGRAPVLKRERNGHICGSSLEFYPECQIDGEFAEFYTSDPLMFQVQLEMMSPDEESYSGILFKGFISPEIYSEPDIAPPYDVQVIATDGLGELKRYLFELSGRQTLEATFQHILSKTGNGIGYHSNNRTLSAGGNYTVPAAKFLENAKIDTDFLSGKTCYEALELILDSIDADIFSWFAGYWQILRETDVESGANITYSTSQNGAQYDITTPAIGFGSMRSFGFWPVGQMETEIKPACKRLMVKTDAIYKDGFVNPDMNSATGWSMSNASYDSNLDAIKITSQYGSVWQKVFFRTRIVRPLKLAIAVRQYRQTSSSPSSAGTVGVIIRKTVTGIGGTTFLHYLAKDAFGEYYWEPNSTTLSFDLPAPAYGETESDCKKIEIILPISNDTSTAADDIEVLIQRNSSNIPLLVHSASLRVANEIAGYQDIFVIDNGAREEADDVDTLFLPSLTGHYNTPAEFMQNILYGADDTAIDIFTQVGTDYAKGCALPRLLKRGTLNIPSALTVVPIVFRDSSGNNYIVRTLEWDLKNSEMSVEILSLPAVSVTISEQQVTEVVYKGGTASSSGSSSGGSGGGGGTGVQSVGLEMPPGFSVSNSPVTGTGTIHVDLDNTLVIPTKTERNAWNEAAQKSHSHTNKPVLDKIEGDVAEIVMQLPTQMLHVAPSVKKFCLQANSTSSNQDAPYFFLRHPLLEAGLPVEVCLMVYRKRNGNGGSRKAHRKGWFLACGQGHAASAAYAEELTPDNGSVAVKERDLLDGIARTYCQIYGAVQSQDYDDWLYWVSQLGADFTAFGFSGKTDPAMTKSKIHFGLAIRMDNPDFWNLYDPQRVLHDDTGSIEGIPRYLYSRVAPLTARMDKVGKGGQTRGGIVFDLI